MIGKLFDRFIEWSLNRQEKRMMKKPAPKKKGERVRRKAKDRRRTAKK